MQNQLNQFPIVIELPVQWGDMDAAKHVNNAIYIRWGESGRTAYFDKMGFDASFSEKVGPILGWQDCKYIFPVTYPDTIYVAVKVTEILSDRFFMECHIFSKKHQRLVAINKNSIIMYDYQALKKVAIPEDWLSQIKAIEE